VAAAEATIKAKTSVESNQAEAIRKLDPAVHAASPDPDVESG
jgi:hypothetical protein